MDITIPYYDAQRNFAASPEAILRYLENAAAEHCAEIGWDIPRLMENGYAWVLSKGQLEMKRYPRYHETISIETWISERSAVHAWREFQILDSGGTLIGSSRGDWVFIDIERRRPTRIIDDFIRNWPLKPVRAIERTMSGAPSEPVSMTHQIEIPVRRMDIDTNNHVNHVRYLEWAVEAVPEDWYSSKELRYIEGYFKHETTEGRSIVSGLKSVKNGFYHSILDKKDAKELSSALSEWV